MLDFLDDARAKSSGRNAALAPLIDDELTCPGAVTAGGLPGSMKAAGQANFESIFAGAAWNTVQRVAVSERQRLLRLWQIRRVN